MKIVHILQTSLDSGQGGIATYLRNVVPIQIKLGHEVKVMTNQSYEQFGDYSIPVKDFNFLKDKKLESLLHSFNVNSQLFFSDFDILHYHFTPSAFFSALPALRNKKRILTIHGRTEVARKLNPLTTCVLDFIGNKVVPNMDEVTTVTPYLKKFVFERYKKNSLYLPHGFSEVSNLDPNLISSKFGLNKNSYYLALGRLTTSKGFDTIINAYKQLPNKNKKLVIAGPAEKKYLKYLKSLIPQEIENQIIFTDRVEGNLLNELYSNAFLYIAGLEVQGLSLTVLEAIAHQTTVINSKSQGCNYGINEFTHRFKAKNSNDLTNLLIRLENDDSQRRQFIEPAFRYAKKHHSWEKIAREFIEIYK